MKLLLTSRTDTHNKALIVTAVAGFLQKFEMKNVELLKESGYEIHYATNIKNTVYDYDADELRLEGVIVHNIPIKQSPFNIISIVISIKKLRHLIRNEGVELIHCHTPFGGLAARLAAKRFKNVKVIYTVHGFYFYKGCSTLKYRVFYRIEKWLAKYTDVIITINHEDYEAAKTMLIKKKNKVWYVPGVGVDMDYYYMPGKTDKKKFREKLGIDSDYLIISVGEIRCNKNQLSVIKALELLQNRGYKEKISYVIIGEGRQRKELQRYVDRKGISNVIFTGYQHDVRPYIIASDAMVFPSIREGLGMAALESLSMGRPVIAAENRGTREYIKAGVNGWMVAPCDIEGYAKAIQELIEDNKCADMRINRKSIEHFSKNNTLKIMRSVYEYTTNKRNNVRV